MTRKSLFKKVSSVALAVAMAVTTFSVTPAKTEAATVLAQNNPLETVVKEVNVGGCVGGDYTQFKDHTFEVRGSGTGFDAVNANDSYKYAYFDAQGNVEVVVKLRPSTGNRKGMIGVIGRNGIDAKDMAAGVYYDYDNGSIYAANHGTSKELARIAALPTDGVYVKLEFSANNMYYTVARNADFSDLISARTSMSVANFNVKNVGFFATAGSETLVEDIDIRAQYTNTSGQSVKKLVYSSGLGELLPVFWTSFDFSGQYLSSFSTSVNGSKLVMTNTKGSAIGDIRKGFNVDYLLFPALNQNATVSADVYVNSVDTTSDKQGVAIGQFSNLEDPIASGLSALACSTLQIRSNGNISHSFITSSQSANSSKVGSTSTVAGNTYSMSYTRNAANTATFSVKNGGSELITNSSAKLSAAISAVGANRWVQYGVAVAGASASVSNLKLTDADGWVLYDQSDYYFDKGTAPVVSNVTASVTSDGKAISVNWNTTNPSNPYSYVVMVSKDGGTYSEVGKATTNKFTYVPATAGSYAFRVYGIASGSSSIDKCATSSSVSMSVATTKNGLISEYGVLNYYKDNVFQVNYTGLVAKDDVLYYIKNGKNDTTFSGMVEYDGTTYYIAKGKNDKEYSGLVEYNGDIYYVASGRWMSTFKGIVEKDGAFYYIENGKNAKTFNGYLEKGGKLYYFQSGKAVETFSGLIEKDGELCYVVNGEVSTSYTGLAAKDGVTYYLVNGKVDTSLNGLYSDPTDKKFYYLKDGVVDFSYTGFVYYKGSKQWHYVIDGVVDKSFTGLVYYEENGCTYYVIKGVRGTDFTGLLYNKEDSKWYYIVQGRVNTSFAGLVYYEASNSYYYVENGTINKEYTGLAYDTQDKIWYYVINGRKNTTYEGLAYYDKTGEWYYVKDGKIDKTMNGLVYYSKSGLYYYVKNGQIDSTVSGLYRSTADNKWYYISAGRQYTKYTGLVYYEKASCYYYVVEGVIDFDYNGTATLGGKTYTVVNGRAK